MLLSMRRSGIEEQRPPSLPMFLSLRFIGTDDGIWDDKQNQVNDSKVDVDWQ